MPRITFFIRSSILYCRVNFKKSTAEFSTGERISKENWCQETQSVINVSSAQRKYVQTLIEGLSYKLKSLALMNAGSSAKSLIESMNPKKCEEPEILLSTIVADYIESQTENKAPGTLKGYWTKYNNLIEFENHTKKKYSINGSVMFNCKTAEDFKQWFCHTRTTNNITVASRHIELYKNSLLQAIREGTNATTDLIHYKPIRDQVKNPVVLSRIEFEKIVNASFPSVHMERIRDLFIFQCTTGLSYCDLYSWNIKQTAAGEMIHGVRKKSKTPYFVPLNEYAKKILDKYNGKLPESCNQVYNKTLHQITEYLGIGKHVTTHVGRKSFATFMDSDAWTMESISRMLGHSSIKTTETYYIGKSSQRIEVEWLNRQNNRAII